MPTYLVERYWPGVTTGRLHKALEQGHRVMEEMSVRQEDLVKNVASGMHQPHPLAGSGSQINCSSGRSSAVGLRGLRAGCATSSVGSGGVRRAMEASDFGYHSVEHSGGRWARPPRMASMVMPSFAA